MGNITARRTIWGKPHLPRISTQLSPMAFIHPARTRRAPSRLAPSVGEVLCTQHRIARRRGCGRSRMSSKNEAWVLQPRRAGISAAQARPLGGLRFCTTVCRLQKRGPGGGRLFRWAPRSTRKPTFGRDTANRWCIRRKARAAAAPTSKACGPSVGVQGAGGSIPGTGTDFLVLSLPLSRFLHLSNGVRSNFPGSTKPCGQPTSRVGPRAPGTRQTPQRAPRGFLRMCRTRPALYFFEEEGLPVWLLSGSQLQCGLCTASQVQLLTHSHILPLG